MKKELVEEYIKEKHKNQKRKNGTAYYKHPLAVARKLEIKGFSEEYQITGLLHDVIEDTNATYEEILAISNSNIMNAVKLLTKETGYIKEEYIQRIKNNPIARMVKLADRIHNVEEAGLVDIHFQKRYLVETEQYYMVLAKGTIWEDDLKNAMIDLKENIKRIEKKQS